ncbi:putative MFS family arabinose efflux permease [Actinocorallia herbida]|uniref:Putative MFS family arabinose efflux permease n=1 Tax=Actinocorallia herbida TaxID=58109 RepID=A0A3N1CZR8_9ACTN|nr:MFS transporter [Actinocorallia herbida]ROO86774.1 putative MFS family arabinose efflux permease [Actinocorallia herbida]
MVETLPPEAALPRKTPPGFVPRLALAQFGLYMAVLAPVIGGLSVKIQNLVGVDAAPSQLGLVAGTGAVLAMVCQPLAGRLSDRCASRFGMRRPFLVGGVVTLAVALVVCALAPNVPVLLVAWCAAQGAANFAFAASGATIADHVPDERRGGVSGIVGAVTPVGILVGSVLLSVLPNDVLRFAVPAGVALVLGLWFALRLPDRVRTSPPAEPLGLRTLLTSFVFDPREHPDFGWAWLSKFFIMLGYGALTSYLTLFLAADFGMTDTDDQLAFNAVANAASVLALVLFSLVGGFASDRVGKRKPFIVGGGLLMALALVGVAGTPLLGDAGLTMIIVLEVVLGLGAGLFFAVDNALCLSLLPNPEDTAKDLGVLNIANALPQSLAPFLAGVAVIPLGNALFDGAGYSIWFLVGAVSCALGALLVLRIRSAA